MKRGLLVIDVQNEYFTGALPITHPTGHLEQILAAMDAAAGKVPTIVVQHHFPDPDKPFFQKGTVCWELHPEVKSRPRDLLVEKILPGSFTGTPLADWLREQGIDTVTIAGYMTHCVSRFTVWVGSLVFPVLRNLVGSKIVRYQAEQFRGTHSAFFSDGLDGAIWASVNATLLQDRHYLLDRDVNFSA